MHQGEAATFLLVVNYVAASFGVALTSLVYTFGSSGMADYQDVLNGFGNSMWFFAVLAVVAIVCVISVPNIVPEKKE